MRRFIFIMATFALGSAIPASAAEWRAAVSCADGSVRLDRDVSSLDGDTYQLVIAHADAIAKLTRENGINGDMRNDRGEAILSGLHGSGEAHFSYLALAPRDEGFLVFRVIRGFPDTTLNLNVAWIAGADLGRLQSIWALPPFSGYTFSGCWFA